MGQATNGIAKGAGNGLPQNISPKILDRWHRIGCSGQGFGPEHGKTRKKARRAGFRTGLIPDDGKIGEKRLGALDPSRLDAVGAHVGFANLAVIDINRHFLNVWTEHAV